MARPKKCRRICRLPEITEFSPGGEAKEDRGEVVISLDEYEALRLIDFESLDQQHSALRMNVARTTVQLIYESARKKVACALVEGKNLSIRGGQYKLCAENKGGCKGRCCRFEKE